ncbi:MAG: hypothetical protein ABR592_00790 [Nitriliruptorales bacterium]
MAVSSEIGYFERRLSRIRDDLVAEARLTGDSHRYEAGVDDALAAVRRLIWDQLHASRISAPPMDSVAR